MLASLGPGVAAAQHASPRQIPSRSASSARRRPGSPLASAVHCNSPPPAAAAGQLLSPDAVHHASLQLSGAAADAASPSAVQSPSLQLLVAGDLLSPDAAHCTQLQLAGAAGDMVGLSPAAAQALPWQEAETKAACTLASPEPDAQAPHATAAALPTSAAGVEQPATPAGSSLLDPPRHTAVAAAAGGGMPGQAAAAANIGDGMQSQGAAAAASRERMRSLAAAPSAATTGRQRQPVARLNADALASAALRWGQPASAQPADSGSVGTAALHATLCPSAATGAAAAANGLRQPRFKVPAALQRPAEPASASQLPPGPGSAVGPRQAPGRGNLHLCQQQSICFPSAAHAALPAARWAVIADSYATVQEYRAALQASLVEELNLR